MEERNELTVTLVEGPDAGANSLALSALQSLSDLVIERVAGFRGIADWVETPCLRSPEGYVVSGVENIRRFVEKARWK